MFDGLVVGVYCVFVKVEGFVVVFEYYELLIVDFFVFKFCCGLVVCGWVEFEVGVLFVVSVFLVKGLKDCFFYYGVVWSVDGEGKFEFLFVYFRKEF